MASVMAVTSGTLKGSLCANMGPMCLVMSVYNEAGVYYIFFNIQPTT